MTSGAPPPDPMEEGKPLHVSVPVHTVPLQCLFGLVWINMA
uniref:Uncharacterized protein n=1 Tax=Anguilla anguilla TaxID=7936 RepID=A0A0E9T6P4_ANGAN